MGTDIYGRFDHLVIELDALDAFRLGRPRLLVPLDDVRAVHLGRPSTAARRLLEVGRHRRPAVVLDLDERSFADRVVVHHRDAAAIVEDLVRCGVGEREETRVPA
jgi:hypothetical protein